MSGRVLGWFTPPVWTTEGWVTDPPQAQAPEDPLKAKIREMVKAGKSDEDIRKALQPKPEEGLKQYGSGVMQEAKDQASMAGDIAMHGAPNPVEGMAGAWGSRIGEALKQVPGIVKTHRTLNPVEIGMHVKPPEGLSALDPTGFSQAAGRDETSSKRAGRATLIGLELMAPWMYGRAATASRAAKAAAAAKELEPVRKTPPPGARLVKNPTDPMAEAVREAAEEARGAARESDRAGFAPKPPQPDVSYPSEAKVQALIKAAEKRKAAEEAARAAAAAKAAPPPEEPPPAPVAAVPPEGPPPGTPGGAAAEIPPAGGKATNLSVEDLANLETWYKFKQLHDAGKLTPEMMRQWAELHNKVKDLKPNGTVTISPHRFEGLPPEEPALTPYRLPDGTRVMLSTSATKGAERTTFQMKGGKIVEAVREPEGPSTEGVKGKLVPAGGEPSGHPVMPTDAELHAAEADAFLSDWDKGGPVRAQLLNQRLKPEVRAAIEAKLAETPGSRPELRKAFGLSDALEPTSAPPLRSFEDLSNRIGTVLKRASEANVPDAEWQQLTTELRDLKAEQAARFPDELKAREAALEASGKAAGGRALSGETTPGEPPPSGPPPPGASPTGTGKAPRKAPGMTKGVPTKTPAQMVEEYGLEEAAARIGLKPDELIARIGAEGDPDKLAHMLRLEVGSEEAARRLGISKEDVIAASVNNGGSKQPMLPNRALRGVRKAIETDRQAGKPISDKNRQLADRFHAERPDMEPLYTADDLPPKGEGDGFTAHSGIDPGAIFRWAKKNPKLATGAGGAAGGALASAYTDPSADEDTQNVNLLGGIAGGAAAGFTVANPAAVFRAYLGARNQGWLSGGAIAKNLITAGAAPVQSAWENLTPGRGRLSAAKEMLRLPTNAKEWWKGTLDAPVKFNPLVPGQSRTPQFSIGGFKPGRLKPSSVIGGIDQSATKALERAGMAKGDVERLLLTKHRNLIRGGLFRDFEAEPPTAADRARWHKWEMAHNTMDALIPFQRVPTNIITEGLADVLHPFENYKAGKSMIDARTAYTLAKTGAAYGIGDWAKKSPRNRFMALLALAAAGPATAPATLAMIKGYGAQGRQMLGGISPFPEISLTPKSLGGWPPSVYTAYQHLVKNK